MFNRINEFYKKLIALATRYIEKAQKDGRINARIDPLVSANCIFASVKELLFRWAVLEIDFDVNKTVNSMLDFYFYGMLKRP